MFWDVLRKRVPFLLGTSAGTLVAFASIWLMSLIFDWPNVDKVILIITAGLLAGNVLAFAMGGLIIYSLKRKGRREPPYFEDLAFREGRKEKRQ